MANTLSRFRIEALHNRYTIDVPINDNRLVLIGENGTGKSTVANFIYFFLTAQWRRMLDYEFKAVFATIDAIDIELTREELLKSRELFKSESADLYLKPFPLSIKRRLLDLLEVYPTEELLNNPANLSYYSSQFNMSPSLLMDLLNHLSDISPLLSEPLQKAVQRLKLSITDKVLYLPTYRRIEQDLTSIFPSLAQASEFRIPMDRWAHRPSSPGYIELVQFGMQDVEDIIGQKMKKLDISWRSDLSRLTGAYLSDVIQGRYKSTEPAEIGMLDEATLDAIFNRVDQSVLPEPDQKRLREMVATIKADKHVRDDDRVVAHYLTRLIELHRSQQEKEKNVQQFVDVCNQYLSGKEFVYDNMDFKISLRQLNRAYFGKKENQVENLKMSMLSSGEKQIVSLFSQIYLSDSSSYFVIIDEPELSLSLTWQKRFLPDILNSDHCGGLIAVTHSPFICDNELDSYMHPLEQFMEPVHDIR